MSVDLRFWQTQTGDPDLLFGASETPAVPHYEVTLADTFPSPVFSAQAIPDTKAALSDSFPALTFSAQAVYASRTARPQVGETKQAQQVATRASSGTQDGFQQTQHVPSEAEIQWQEAAHSTTGCVGRHTDSARLGMLRGSHYQSAASVCCERRAAHQEGRRIKFSRSTKYQSAARVKSSRCARHQDGIRIKRDRNSRYQDALSTQRFQFDLFQKATPWVLCWDGRFQDAMRPIAGRHIDAVTPETPVPVWTADLLFAKPWGGTGLVFGWKSNHTSSTIVVPVRSVYIVINDISLRRVSNGIALPPTSFSFSIDRDSWTWSFNAAFPLRSLADLEPDSNGTPVELLAEINGNAYRFVVETITRARAFPSGSISVTGRGRSAFLDSPYSPALSFTSSTERMAQQLMADALTYNGASIGWDIDWRITDWLVPAGAWAHQGSYISAIKTIAEAAGAYLQPHATLQQLRVLPAYPVAPWEWSTVTPDIELPSAVTAREGIEWVNKAEYNAVYLAGSILGRVIRSGTAGDELAPMVTDPLITHADAARQRGIAILGDTGRMANLSLSLPVLPETGIIVPGIMPNYIDNGIERLGIVRSTSVSVQYPSVMQTIGVETHVA